jgi:hypothetical protein
VRRPGGEERERGIGHARARLVFFVLEKWPRFTPPPSPFQSKIRAALDKAAFLPSPLTGVPLTVVDIASLPDGGGGAGTGSARGGVAARRRRRRGDARPAHAPARDGGQGGGGAGGGAASGVRERERERERERGSL